MQIVMPKLNDCGDPGIVEEIFVRVGDPVIAGRPVMAVEMEKAVIEIEANVSGTVREIAVQVGEKVVVGQILMQLE